MSPPNIHTSIITEDRISLWDKSRSIRRIRYCWNECLLLSRGRIRHTEITPKDCFSQEAIQFRLHLVQLQAGNHLWTWQTISWCLSTLRRLHKIYRLTSPLTIIICNLRSTTNNQTFCRVRKSFLCIHSAALWTTSSAKRNTSIYRAQICNLFAPSKIPSQHSRGKTGRSISSSMRGSSHS